MTTSFHKELLTCIPELRCYALKLTGEYAAAEDLVQDCLERALRNAEKFELGTNLEAWLTTIIKNLFFTQCRRCRRCHEVELDEHDGIVPPPQITRIALHEVEGAIHALPPRQRDLLQLVAIDGVSYQDAADRLGVPVGTIRSRLSRAREQVRHILERRERSVRAPSVRAVQSHPAPPPPAAAAAPDTAAPAPGALRLRPSALPVCLAELCRRFSTGASRAARLAVPPRWEWLRRRPVRERSTLESIRTRGPPSADKRPPLRAGLPPPDGTTRVVGH
ncbi:sigma-70 family RNA polymerase sigma factor [Azospirillum sp. TSO35-2]|uniref:sigma-70 family RNA polymerase sigma factor n=1 Tax=Azospirillum sp. TSO35-2 TaxID=716796 RepID=UPI000D644226|nr:sigma-70 family RNA polymerase sigma factor [Azospirillum sp. TSO35-2]